MLGQKGLLSQYMIWPFDAVLCQVWISGFEEKC